MTLINFFTSWYFVTVLFIINFVGAHFLKVALITTVKENPWLKYIFIIPPTAIVCWLLALCYSLYYWVKGVVINYFKN